MAMRGFWLVGGLAVASMASAATFNVQTGCNFFRDDVSQTNVTRIIPGDFVRWYWACGSHTTTREGMWDEVINQNQQTFTYGFDVPGSYAYFCRPHPNMVGTVVVYNPRFYAPTSFSVAFGNLRSGSLAELAASDDAYVVIDQRPPFGAANPSARILAETVAANEAIEYARIKVELACSALPSSAIVQRCELFNFVTGRFVVVDERAPSTSDIVLDLPPRSGYSEYVDPVTRTMRAQVSWFDRGTLAPNWQVRVDQVSLITGVR